MAQIDKIQVGSTTYDIAPSANATNTFTSGDVADGSATSWTTVAALASGETTSSILGKISNMFKNIRYLYKQMGTTDISGTGADVKAAIAALASGKADSGHTHTASDLKDGNGNSLIVTSQTADNDHVPSALLVKNMNDTLTSLNDASTSYVTSLSASGTTITYKNKDGTSLGTFTTQDNNTTYANFTSATAGLTPAAKSGTTNIATTGYVLTGAGWAAGTKYNTDTNTTYANFGSGSAGLVPAPTAAQATTGYVLTGTGWAAGTKYNTDTNTTYANFTSAAPGLVPAAKSGTTNIATSGYVLTGAGWKAGTKYNTDTTYALATSTSNGLMSNDYFRRVTNLYGLYIVNESISANKTYTISSAGNYILIVASGGTIRSFVISRIGGYTSLLYATIGSTGSQFSISFSGYNFTITTSIGVQVTLTKMGF